MAKEQTYIFINDVDKKHTDLVKDTLLVLMNNGWKIHKVTKNSITLHTKD